jgi:hypothetical protein
MQSSCTLHSDAFPSPSDPEYVVKVRDENLSENTKVSQLSVCANYSAQTNNPSVAAWFSALQVEAASATAWLSYHSISSDR